MVVNPFHRGSASRRVTVAALAILAAFAFLGCGGAVGGIFPFTGYPPPRIVFTTWTLPAGSTCTAGLQNDGDDAGTVRVEVWYATGAAESSLTVTAFPNPFGHYRRGQFYAPGQRTNDEWRFPRLGTITWTGGSVPAQPRLPAPTFFMCFTKPDTVSVWAENDSGWAYHMNVKFEDRNGVQEAVDARPLQGILNWHFECATRDSAGKIVPPRLLSAYWEDYGGTPDSVAPVPVTGVFSCGSPVP